MCQTPLLALVPLVLLVLVPQLGCRDEARKQAADKARAEAATRPSISATASVPAEGCAHCRDGPLHEAAMTGDVRAARAALDGGIRVNARGEYGNTPLYYASGYCDRPGMVELLLERGADPNLAGDMGNTPLHVAAEGGCLDIVKRLVGKGAAVNTPNTLEETPLEHAMTKPIEDFLRSKGARD